MNDKQLRILLYFVILLLGVIIPFIVYNIVKDKRNKTSPLFDCYLDQAISSVNVCEVENLISHEHAEYLRNKYFR